MARGINDAEYKRMRQQAEVRMAGQTEVGFRIEYLKEDNSSSEHWIQRGYIGNIDLNFGATKPLDSIGVTSGAYITGHVEVPIRYYQAEGNAFTIRSAPAGYTEAIGKTFNFSFINDSGASYFISPGEVRCYEIIPLSLFNLSPVDDSEPLDRFNLVTPPQIYNDRVRFEVQAVRPTNRARIASYINSTVGGIGGYTVAGTDGSIFTTRALPRGTTGRLLR